MQPTGLVDDRFRTVDTGDSARVQSSILLVHVTRYARMTFPVMERGWDVPEMTLALPSLDLNVLSTLFDIFIVAAGTYLRKSLIR